MKQWIWIFALWCGAWSASAQTLVKGRILDTENQPVGYATAAIVRDSLPLAAAASDLDGRFELRVREQGAYTLTISSVGYSTYTAPLSIGNEPLDLGEIHLTAGVEVDAVEALHDLCVDLRITGSQNHLKIFNGVVPQLDIVFYGVFKQDDILIHNRHRTCKHSSVDLGKGLAVKQDSQC